MDDREAPFELGEVLGYVIVRVAAALEHAFTEVVAAEGLTVRQFGILSQLAGGDVLTAAEIARRIGVTAQGLGRQVDTLVTRGLLERGPHPGPGRPIDVRITGAGRDRFLRAARLARAEQQRTTGHLAPDEHRVLLEQLREIGRRAEVSPEPDTG